LAKATGITTTVNIDDAGGTPRNLSNDILSINVATPRGMVDVTGLDKAAIERLPLLADGTCDVTMGFNTTATTGQHAVMSTILSSNATRTVTVLYNTTPTATLTMEMLFSTYAVARAQDGSLQATASGVLANGVAPAWS
jgi:hypothetical protein